MSDEPAARDDPRRPTETPAEGPPSLNLPPAELSPIPSRASLSDGDIPPRKRAVVSGRPAPSRKSGVSAYLFARDRSIVPEFLPRHVSQWKAPVKMLVFFAIGLATSVGHVVFYVNLRGGIVGNEYDQENNIRVGTAFAFISQIALTAAVWLAYTQWIWRSVKNTNMSIPCLDAIYGADTSVFSLLNVEMLRKFKLGSLVALFAWCLLLPPFFTPATLFVARSTTALEARETVPVLAISDATEGRRFAYSPPTKRNTTRGKDDGSRTFTGPRTILSLLSTATASLGEILPLRAPHNHSEYRLEFLGPYVTCADADAAAAAAIDGFLSSKMSVPLGRARETRNAYYAFVPVYGASGELTAVAKPRNQSPSNATNEIWMTFTRYVLDAGGERTRNRTRHRQVCRLYNATYSVALGWDGGRQVVNGSATTRNEVAFPVVDVGGVSDMAQHAYAAFMWVLADQVVGSLSWYEQPEGSPVEDGISSAAQFGVIDTPIQHTALLGSDDLDPFFDFGVDLYGFDPTSSDRWGDQRLQDKNLARNRTLAELVEELSFNITVSLMHNELLTHNTTTTVRRIEDVNRYGYLPHGLFIPYVLANLFTLAVVVLGCVSYRRDSVLPGKDFSDIAMASRDPEIVAGLRERRGSLKVAFDKEGPLFKSGEPFGSMDPFGAVGAGSVRSKSASPGLGPTETGEGAGFAEGGGREVMLADMMYEKQKKDTRRIQQ